MRLPEKFIRDGLESAKGAKISDVPLEDLTRDELIATCAFLTEQWMGAEKTLKVLIGNMTGSTKLTS